MIINKLANEEEASRVAADIFKQLVAIKPDCVLGLATGTSPLGLYEMLAKMNKNGEIDFSRVRTVNLDEYCGLPPSHAQSYRYFMDVNLFDKVNIDKTNTFLPNGTAPDTDEECRRYDGVIESLGGIDLQLLGIGLNGHIGFNEPEGIFSKGTHRVKLTESTIKANSRLFAEDEEVPEYAFTMGIQQIMQAKKILLLAGPGKMDIVERALNGEIDPMVPASVLQLHRDVTVVMNI